MFTESTSQQPSPSELLATAINKRRSVMSHKNRDFRIELLLDATIKNLCKFIGQERASRKRKRYSESTSSEDHPQRVKVRRSYHSPAVRHCDSIRRSPSQRSTGLDTVVSGSGCTQGNSSDHTTMDAISNDFSAQCECSDGVTSKMDTYNENDPFGLDAFFASLRTCRS